MAIQTITYADKTALNENAGVNAVNKCQASDLNEIKSVVNNNATELANIVESGSNANGNWIKYPDGTMICYGDRSFSGVNITSQFGSVYETTSEVNFGTFPQTFYATPNVFIQQTGGAMATIETLTDGSTTALGKAYLWRPNSRSNTGPQFKFMAIGRWKQ